MDMERYEELFREEASGILESISLDIIALEKGDQEKLEELFRNIHTLKGMAASMGYEDMETLSHKMEDLLSNVRDGKYKINSEFIDLMLKCSDMLQTLFENTFGKKKKINISEIIAKIDKFGKTKNFGDKPKDTGNLIYTVKIIIGGAPEFKGVRAAVVYKELSEHGRVISSTPIYEKLINGEFDNTFIVDIETELPSAKLKKFIEDMLDVEKVEIRKSKVKNKLPSKETEIKSSEVSLKENVGKQTKGPVYVRVKMDKLDELQNLIAELIITKSAFNEYMNTKNQSMLEDAIQKISRLISSLQDEVGNMRMVPLEEIFNKFPRFVRDGAKELGKEINFVVKGEQIEIDRSLISGIYDPILHILKNSMDHGIESPQERKKAGKNVTGLIELKARREKNNVDIEIFDDGRGIDTDKIKEKIFEKGLLSEEEADNLTEQELFSYIKLEGFSTSSSVTKFSGRGVGIDAVDKMVRRLGGHLFIDSKRGHWTKITIRLPLTLSIIKAMIVSCNNALYAIPLENIQETVDVYSDKISSIHKQEVTVLRDDVYPVIRLRNVINADEINNGEILQGIVVGDGASKAILVVDNYETQTEIVVKNLPSIFDNVDLYSGISILGTGKMALILDINNLI
ncbi:hypothetical protein DRP44_03405 [candidate division TA06 bacterium]|uniref:Chemotaxis protein CheA n=1 Tax=candidate division TA06 bacterium TaxID=2250710 RepID=A0A660S906_UNCT6|nr:MAG: hypothetical protein DRP44_03405 [candidate division TA06 bacterium]